MPEPNREPLTLAGALELLGRRGFTASFVPAEGGLHVSGRPRTYTPEELTIRGHYRFEGLSDPDDLSVAYAIETSDGTRGVLVDGFGAYADPRVAAALRDVPVHAASRGPGSAVA